MKNQQSAVSGQRASTTSRPSRLSAQRECDVARWKAIRVIVTGVPNARAVELIQKELSEFSFRQSVSRGRFVFADDHGSAQREAGA